MDDYLDDDLNIRLGINWWTMMFGVDNEDYAEYGDIYKINYNDEVCFFKVIKTAPHYALVQEIAKNKVRRNKDVVGWMPCSNCKRTSAPKMLTKEENREGSWVHTFILTNSNIEYENGAFVLDKDYRSYYAMNLTRACKVAGVELFKSLWTNELGKSIIILKENK